MSHTPGPCERAFVDASGCVTVPCSGTVQAADVLPYVQNAVAMAALLREVFADPAALNRPWEWAEREAWVAKVSALLAKIDAAGGDAAAPGRSPR